MDEIKIEISLTKTPATSEEIRIFTGKVNFNTARY